MLARSPPLPLPASPVYSTTPKRSWAVSPDLVDDDDDYAEMMVGSFPPPSNYVKRLAPSDRILAPKSSEEAQREQQEESRPVEFKIYMILARMEASGTTGKEVDLNAGSLRAQQQHRETA